MYSKTCLARLFLIAWGKRSQRTNSCFVNLAIDWKWHIKTHGQTIGNSDKSVSVSTRLQKANNYCNMVTQ